MRKILLAILICLMLTMITSAQEIYFGAGTLLTNNAGNALAYSTKYETNYNIGGRWVFTNNLGVAVQATKDTVKIGKWLDKHNFIISLPQNYAYTKVSAGIEYYFKNFYLVLATPIFFSPNKNVDTKIGIEAGIGTRYYFNDHLGMQAETRFCHIQDFLVPVANTLFCNFSVIWKW